MEETIPADPGKHTIPASSGTRPWLPVAWLGLGVYVTLLALAAFARQYPVFGAETDFLGGLIWDANAFLTGETPGLRYKPPLYPVMLALVQTQVHDWFTSGRLISISSSALYLVVTFVLLHRAVSLPAAVGGIAALLASPVFLSHSAMASTELMFLCLYGSALLLTFTAADRYSLWRWVVAGILSGLTMLTRTNGVIALLFPLFLLFTGASTAARFRMLGGFVAGISAPLLLWWGIATLAGYPYGPSMTYMNLAMTYFSPTDDRISGDAMHALAGQYSGIWSVLSHDPVHIIKVYLRDLYSLPGQLFRGDRLFAYPVNVVIGCAAVLWVFVATRSKWMLALVLVSGLHILLVNFKAYEPRFYIFLVPLFGATLGHTYHLLSPGGAAGDPWQHFSGWLAKLVIFPLAALGIASAASSAVADLMRDDAELGASIKAAGSLVPAGSLVIARKPHLPHYIDSSAIAIPPDSGIAELREYMTRYAGESEVFLYFGKIERMTWKDLQADLAGGAPAWLVPLATVPGQWTLYRFDASCCPLDDPQGD